MAALARRAVNVAFYTANKKAPSTGAQRFQPKAFASEPGQQLMIRFGPAGISPACTITLHIGNTIVSLTYLRFVKACLSQHLNYRAADDQVNPNPAVPPREQRHAIWHVLRQCTCGGETQYQPGDFHCIEPDPSISVTGPR